MTKITFERTNLGKPIYRSPMPSTTGIGRADTPSGGFVANTSLRKYQTNHSTAIIAAYRDLAAVHGHDLPTQ